MTECCGKVRETRFCPDCGQELAGDPLPHLRELLFHCRDGQQQAVNEWADALPPSGAGLDANFYRKKLAARRWKAWGDALEELIRERQPRQPDLTP